MRTATAGQLSRLRATDCIYAVRVRIVDAAAGVREWTNYLSTDWVFDLEVTREIEASAARLSLTLAGGEPTRLASPLVTASTVNSAGRALNPGRAVTVEVQSLAPGAAIVAGDWVTVFDGTIDELDVTAGKIALTARDRFGPILESTFDAEQTFPSNDVANVLRAMLNAIFGAGAIPLVVPVDPAWTAPAVTVSAGTSLGDALLSVVRQLGWRLEFRFNGNTPELQLLEPRRSPSSADWTLAADDILSVREVRLDRVRLRNSVTVIYRDPSSGARQSWTSEDAASIAANGRRALVIREAATSEIRTSGQAQRMADAILSDLKDLGLSYQIETRALWPVELGDVLDVGGLPAISDSTQRLAVQRHTMRISGGARPQIRSTLLLRGRPAAQSDTWFRIGDGQLPSEGETTASASFTSAGSVRINVIGPTTSTVVRAAVSTVGPPTGADVDAATGSLSAAASMAALTSSTTYAVGTTVYVAAAAYTGGVRGRVIQLVIQRDAASGTVAIGPDLEVRLALSATDGTITYFADGSVEISEDGSDWSTAPASPIVRSRAAAGSNVVKTVSLRATLSGQSMSNTVVIPPLATVDTDTVAPDLRLIRESAGADVATYVSYTVQVSNPKAGGPTPSTVGTWRGTTVDRWNGSSWVTMSSGAALFSGDLLRMTRPANGSEPGSFTARATITGGGAEEITVSIPQQAVALPPSVVCRITGSTNETVTVTADTVPAGGTVRWLGNGATRLSGALAGVDVAAPAVWTFQRNTFAGGAQTTDFRGTVAGVSDDDTITIPEQGRDTIAILTRARVITMGATTATVRVSGSSPYVERDGTSTVVQAPVNIIASGIGEQGETGALGLTVSTVDGYYGAIGGVAARSFIDYVCPRPPVGGQPYRYSWRVSAPGVTADLDSVDVPPQEALTPGRVEVVGFAPSGASLVVRWRAWDAAGAAITAAVNVAHAIVQTPPSGAPTTTTGTPTWDAANSWWATTITRTAGAAVRVDLVVDGLSASGTARTVVPVTVPTFNEPAPGASDAFSSVSLTANVGSNQLQLSYTLASTLAGATVNTYLEILYNDAGAPNPAGIAGSRGSVAFPWTPDTFTLAAFASGVTTTYLARVVLEAVVAGRIAGTSYAGTNFYVNTSGT